MVGVKRRAIEKVIAIVLVLCMALSLGVFAEGETRIYSEAEINAAAGSEFTVPVYIENNPGIYCFTVSITYDEDVVEAVEGSEQAGDILPTVLGNPTYMNTPDTRVVGINVDNVADDGLLFTYRFRIKEGVSAGQTTLSISTTTDSVKHLEQDLTTTVVDCAGSTCTVNIGTAAPTSEPTSDPTSNPTANPEMPSFALKADAQTIKYMAPVSDFAFEPDRAATRYEVSEALYELLDFSGLEEADRFSDVDEAHREMVNALAQTPIIDGYPDGTFGGGQSITRAEFVKMVSVAAGIEQGGAQTEFTDLAPEHWASPYISAFVAGGYIYGYPDGTFLPESEITRAEAVAIINRVLGVQKADDAAPRFDDLPADHWAYGDIMAAAK